MDRSENKRFVFTPTPCLALLRLATLVTVGRIKMWIVECGMKQMYKIRNGVAE